jgi:hypothetical protein
VAEAAVVMDQRDHVVAVIPTCQHADTLAVWSGVVEQRQSLWTHAPVHGVERHEAQLALHALPAEGAVDHGELGVRHPRLADQGDAAELRFPSAGDVVAHVVETHHGLARRAERAVEAAEVVEREHSAAPVILRRDVEGRDRVELLACFAGELREVDGLLDDVLSHG